MPKHDDWNNLSTPRDYDEYGVELTASEHKVRNQKGRVAAVAYRERGHHPYNYVVYSYDERGRVEALLRYTDNLGLTLFIILIIQWTYLLPYA